MYITPSSDTTHTFRIVLAGLITGFTYPQQSAAMALASKVQMQARVQSTAAKQALMAPCVSRTVASRSNVAVERVANLCSPSAAEVRCILERWSAGSDEAYPY